MRLHNSHNKLPEEVLLEGFSELEASRNFIFNFLHKKAAKNSKKPSAMRQQFIS
jgi:hypothetical protein